MALEPDIILQAGRGVQPLDVGGIIQLRDLSAQRQTATALAQQQARDSAAKQVRLGQIGTIAATGDIAGARTAALQAGDFDLVDHVNKLDDRAKGALAAKVGVAAPVFATALQERDPVKRTQIIAAAIPTLKANGYTEDEIAKINPTDEFLTGSVANARSISDIIKSQEFGIEQEGKRLDRDLRREEAAATRDSARGNAYISAGLLPPDAPGGGGVLAGSGGGSTAGRTQFGWTPRSRNGGDNTDAAVDGKIAGMAKALGVDPDAPLTGMSPLQIAGALTLSEGGPGSIADKNNNPGNLRDPKTLAYRRFPTKTAGLEAAAAQVRRNLARGQTTIRTMVEGLPVGGGGTTGAGGLRVIPGGKLDNAADELTPTALERAAIVYGTTGNMPTGLGRSGSTQKAILNKWAEIANNGGTTPEQQVQNWQTQKAQTAAVKSFASGPEARTVRSLNVAVDHLHTLQIAAQALQNGDIPAFNKVRQFIAKQTGATPPTNFEAIKGIVADEVTKAVIGGGNAGALADREETKATIQAANSPQQLAGVIAKYTELMGGQLNGLRGQYEQATGRKDFNSRLLPMTRRRLGIEAPREGGTLSPRNGAVPRVSSAADYNRLPSGARYLDPQGNQRTKR